MPLQTTRIPYVVEVKFRIGDRVFIDATGEDDDVSGVVTAYTYRSSSHIQAEVAWWNGRNHCTAWFDEHRLSPAPNKRPGFSR